MELIAVDSDEAEVVIAGIIYNVKYDVNFDCEIAEPQVMEIYREGDSSDLFDLFTVDQVAYIEDLIDKYADRREWLEDHMDSLDYMTSKVF
jgi:hypothetical protein